MVLHRPRGRTRRPRRRKLPATRVGRTLARMTALERVAGLYDIHGNLPALEATLAEVDAVGCDRIVVGGDVALGPMPRETLDLLLARGDRVSFVRGNCDREMISMLGREPEPAKPLEARFRWAVDQLTPAQRELLAGLPTTLELEVDGLGPVLFCHGSPRDDDEIFTRATPESRIAPALAGVTARVVLCGHTHVQYDRVVNGVRLVNAGSVGMPFEGRPGAYWTLLGPDVTPRITHYDLDRAARDILASGYPRADEFVRQDLLAPMTADEAIELMEKYAQQRGPG